MNTLIGIGWRKKSREEENSRLLNTEPIQLSTRILLIYQSLLSLTKNFIGLYNTDTTGTSTITTTATTTVTTSYY